MSQPQSHAGGCHCGQVRYQATVDLSSPVISCNCKTCGIKSFARGTNADGSPMVAINTRCLDDVDLEKLNVKKFDGKSR